MRDFVFSIILYSKTKGCTIGLEKYFPLKTSKVNNWLKIEYKEHDLYRQNNHQSFLRACQPHIDLTPKKFSFYEKKENAFAICTVVIAC